MERAVISCWLQAPDLCAGALIRTLKATDFHNPALGTFFDVLTGMTDTGRKVDLLTFTQEITDRGLSEKTGGVGYISETYTTAVNPAAFADYAREVKIKSRARRIMQAAWTAAHAVQTEPTEETLKEASGTLVDTVLSAMADDARVQIVPLKEALFEAVEEIQNAVDNRGHVTGERATGFTHLDRLFIKGLARGENVVIAGDTSMGKTSLAVQIMENMATGTGHYREFYDYDVKRPDDWQTEIREGRARSRFGKQCCLLICLESSQIEMAEKMLLGRAGVNMKAMQSGLMSHSDMRAITGATEQLGTAPFWIWDAAGVCVEDLCAEVKSFKLQHPDLALVCVDHCGLLGARAVRDAGNETAVAGYVSSMLRILYKQCDVVGISLWQLNREAAAKGTRGQRPTRADLRSSGRIEQDATKIILPYRPGHYKQDEDTDETEAYLVIAKNRGGPINLNGIQCRWDAATTRFLSEEKDDQGVWRPCTRLFSTNKDHHQLH